MFSLLQASPETKTQPSKRELAINAYSLLYSLLSEEKDLEKILAITRERKEIDPLIREISAASLEALEILDRLQKNEPSIRFDQDLLPPGERETREIISKTKSKDLLTTSGEKFSVVLLLSQSEALTYASHLASVASKNDENLDRARKVDKIAERFEKLNLKVTQLLTVKNPH